jgi:hypothetical protein
MATCACTRFLRRRGSSGLEDSTFIRTLVGQEAAGRIVSLLNGIRRSAQFLAAADGMGFSCGDNWVTEGLRRQTLVQGPLGGRLHHLRPLPASGGVVVALPPTGVLSAPRVHHHRHAKI